MTARAVFAAGAIASALTLFTGAAGAQEMGSQAVPPADQPLVRKIPTPRIGLEAGAGVLGYTGGAASLGPAWNVRVTGNLSRRFAIEGSYVGSVSEASRVNDTLVMTSFNAGLRYNILPADVGPVQPYAVAGVGYAGWSGKSGDPATLIFPLGIGVERMLTRSVKVGARANFTPAFFDKLGSGPNAPGGDTWALQGHLGGAF